MEIAAAQRDVRRVFVGGFVGQLVSGGLWLLSAALATWSSPGRGILVLVVGGMFIFPLTQLFLLVMGRRPTLAPGNPMGQLATQIALTIPLNLLLVGAATLHRLNWFYPACMIVVGTHYLPFVFLYGMRVFAGLAAVLVLAGLGIGLYLNHSFALGGWVTAGVLFFFALLGRSVALRERAGEG